MHIRIEVTNVCNLKCRMCPQSIESGEGKRFISPELFEKIVTDLSNHVPGSSLSFHISGEPLLHRDLPSFVNFSEKLGFKTNLVTNATLLSGSIADQLLNSDLSKITFSFEGYDKQEYEALRSGANYDSTWANIRNFVRENRGRIHTELTIVALPKVKMQKIRDYAQQVKPFFHSLKISGYFDWLGKMERVAYSKGQYRPCSVLSTDINILSDGRVIPCCMDVSGSLSFGNLIESTYKEILESPQRAELQRRLRTGDLGESICKDCANVFGYNRHSEMISGAYLGEQSDSISDFSGN